MECEIRYYVIFSLETEGKISRAKPRYISYPTFKVTEDHPEFVDHDLTLNHRKYVGIITAEKLKEILKEESFRTCETLGSLTLEYGLLGAISFDFESPEAYMNAYVSPIVWDDRELHDKVEALPESQKKLVIDFEISPKMENIFKILKGLENLGYDEEIELPSKVNFSIEQRVLEFPEFKREEAQV